MSESSESIIWQTRTRAFDCRRKTLVMGILNRTPDSFSDGGKFNRLDDALRQAEILIGEGADILDIGGESTRPHSRRISEAEELSRVVPLVQAVRERFDIAVSIDTTKATIARAAVEAGADIINDISGLRWDEQIARVAAETKAGLILMHSRGSFETLHAPQNYVELILPEVVGGLRESRAKAVASGVEPARIALDIGIGFGKKMPQNLELLARLDEIRREFADSPILVGTSRKSFIGKLLSDDDAVPVQPENRLHGTTASAAIAIFNGANIIRVHDVRPAVEAARIADAIKNARKI